MDSKDLLMNRLARASHNKIYPSILPKSEIQLRKILLATRLWNEVRRQQEEEEQEIESYITKVQNDWSYDEDEDDDYDDDDDDDNSRQILDELDLNMLLPSTIDIEKEDNIINMDQNNDDGRVNDEEGDNDEFDHLWPWINNNNNDNINNEQKANYKKNNWSMDSPTHHETSIPLVMSTSLTTTQDIQDDMDGDSIGLNDNNTINNNNNSNNNKNIKGNTSIINNQQDKEGQLTIVENDSNQLQKRLYMSSTSSLENEPSRKRSKTSSSSPSSSSTFTTCTSSTTSTSNTNSSSAGPTSSNPVLLSV